MDDIVRKLRCTRADMLGTDDEEHYWHCHEAAAEIERLQERFDLALRKNGEQWAEIKRLRRRLEWIMDEYAEQKAGVERIQILLEMEADRWQEDNDE